jgi:hypothetical protein
MSKKNNAIDSGYPYKSVRVGRLDTLAGVRNELAKLYRVARQRLGEDVDVQSAAKLAYLLNCIGRSLEGYELEKRIEELELRLKTGQ